MATRRSRHTLVILSLLFFIICLFVFTKRALDSDFTFSIDLASQPPLEPHSVSPPRSSALDENFTVSGEKVPSAVVNRETEVPSASNSDGVDETEGETAPIGSSPYPGDGNPKIEEKTGESGDAVADKSKNCDLFQGTWMKDEGYPLYRPGSCPYVDEGFDCQNNGRPDSEYLKWRWKPDGCDLPRFNATDFLVQLRGKKLMLVGDSMNRNQFESLLCLLREALHNKSKMYEVHGYKITKGRGYYVFKFEDYNCTVDFVRSHFLVKEGTRFNTQGNSNPTLSIDRIDKTANRWLRADILVFNTGHWWTHGKTARG